MASTLAQTSMAGATAAGPGSTVDFLTAKKTVTAVIVVSATLSEGVVTIEASQDNLNWIPLRTCPMTDMQSMAVPLSDVAFRYWRANLAVAAVGGTVRVTFMEAD